MGSFIDQTGKTFGRLTVLSYEGHMRWRCQCQCGNFKSVRTSHLVYGKIQSCGCLRDQQSRERALAGVPRKNFDGRSRTPEYSIFLAIRQRCNNPNNTFYHYYGGRGIKICDRWSTFDAFIADMGRKPDPKSTIDRIDTNGDYTPENCRWVSRKVQQNNCRNNRRLTFNGITKTIAEWSQELGIHRNTIDARLLNGWSVQEALTIPILRRSR